MRRAKPFSLYGWLFSLIPGPLWLRIVIVVVIAAAIVVGLFQVVFPTIAPYLPISGVDGTVSTP